MKSAEEVARKLIAKQAASRRGWTKLGSEIAKAITAYAEERVQEACLSDKKIEFIANLVKQARAEGIREGREEAVRILEEMPVEPTWKVREAIRALGLKQ